MSTSTSSPRLSLLALGVVLFCICAFGASAQLDPHAAAQTGMPDVPTGRATLRGQLRHSEGNARAAGAAVVLYALSADGSPGVRSGIADGDGAFAFENISNAPGIVYLVGARYDSVPYGERVRFEPGQDRIDVVIDVMEPSPDGSRISISASSLRIEWLGASLAVEEVHQLVNPDASVVFVPESSRANATPPFRSELPAGSDHLDKSLAGLGTGFEVQNNALAFWGPIYSGTHELRYRYRIPVAGTSTPVRWVLPRGSQRASLQIPEDGPAIIADGLTESENIVESERRYRVLDAGEIAPGGALAFRVDLPETRRAPEAIQLSRVDAWVEVDDTFQQTTLEYSLQVEPGARVAGSLEAPLLQFELPKGAEFSGLSPEAANLGVYPDEKGGLSLVGPLAAGESSFSFRYRVATRGNSNVDFRFPTQVELLNVFIADTGVIVETDRLHRRRPFRSGTRLFLHRQAFQVEAGEKVSLSLTPIERSSTSSRASLFSAVIAAGLCVWFVLIPLAESRSQGEKVESGDAARSERELLYGAIRDIDHDFETGKLQPEEHQLMHNDLRDRALTLLQAERESAAEIRQPPPPRFCPSCGESAETSWRFCAACGGPLPETPANAHPQETTETTT